MANEYQKDIKSIFAELQSSANGLQNIEAKNRLEQYGPNFIPTEKQDSAMRILLRQFKSFIIWILFLTATISYLIGHLVESAVILLIIIFILMLNFFMEFRATKEMESLIQLAPKKSRVRREGKEITIDSKELVVGDILLLNRGDIVGGDARIMKCSSFTTEEAALTGESMQVHKDCITITEMVSLAKRSNMVFSGTPVTNGHAEAIVTATGEKTEFGKISKLMKEVKKDISPLQKRLNKLSKKIALFALFFSAVAFSVGLMHGTNWLEMIIFSMAIIVSGIPESLPTAVGICLAFGVKRMSKENAIVKRLPAVETLGTCSVICTDKTGTLTQNKMIVEKIFTLDVEVDVDGDGYTPKGLFLKDKKVIDISNHKTVSKAIEISLLCNNADINEDGDKWTVDGEPTEGALVTLAQKAGMIKLDYNKKYSRKAEHGFDPNRKMMSVINEYDNQQLVHTKGAPEFVLNKANFYLHEGTTKRLSSRVKSVFLRQNEKYASQGYRVLAVAYKEHTGSDELHQVEKELVFVGLLAIRDPPDPSTFDAIKKCKAAGIKPVMITGDNKVTAAAIASELGIFSAKDNILTGEELDKVVNEKEEVEFLRMLDSVTVFARTTPAHKLMIVEALQKKGHVVAMTGDGINDAPALKKADIGVAMGQRGSEVAKESAELILKDDKFSTIVKAVESGRNIFSNIRKFIYYLLVGSISEVILILLAVIVGINLPLTALMILFINLVTSEFPAIGLSLEKSNPNIMKNKPRSPKENILNDFVILRIFSTVPIMILGTLSLYIWELFNSGDIVKAQTITFATIIFFELFHTYNTKSWNNSIISKDVFSNKALNFGVLTSLVLTLLVVYTPILQSIFGTVPLSVFDWLLVILVSSSILLYVELKKYTLKVEMKEKKKTSITGSLF